MIRSNRTCNNPTPSCGGVYCRGISTHEETCNELCCRGKILHYIINRTYVAITVQLNLHLTLASELLEKFYKILVSNSQAMYACITLTHKQ